MALRRRSKYMGEAIALYHRVMRRENFEKAAKDLFDLLRSAQANYPNTDRILYVDIDGHKNSAGGYDNDMYELQKDFGLGLLGKYFIEIHFPLGDFINSKPQRNDIPTKLEIFSSENKKDSQLDDLYIENYSNTEFISEPDVYDYIKKVHNFLLEFQSFDLDCIINSGNQINENHNFRLWKNHISELTVELYNSFIYGNLLTVTAMTRTLIECFVYFSILSSQENNGVIHEWYLCSLCNSMKNDPTKLEEYFKVYCNLNSLNFEEKWDLYNKKPNANKWLKQLGLEPTFKGACNFLNDEHIYQDFESACSFVHGQDISSKTAPFRFYVSICYRFNMMMLYIFRTIRLFSLNNSLEDQLISLEDELIELLEKYYN